MKKTIMKIMAILLTVAMICGMFPAFASAAKVEEERPVEISKKSEEIINAMYGALSMITKTRTSLPSVAR